MARTQAQVASTSVASAKLRPATSGRAAADVQSCASWKVTNRQLSKKAKTLSTALRLPDVHDADAIEAVRADQDAQCTAERRDLLGAVACIRDDVRVLQGRMQALQPAETYLQSLQELMGGLQDSIAGLKERQRVRFRELQQQQALCERDLALFADRLDSPAWQDAAMPAASTATAPVEVTVAAHEAAAKGGTGLLPEIVEFDAYVEEYGVTGGWHEDDHREFLRHLRHHRGDYSATVLACCGAMLGFERLDIVAHARWHAAFEELAMRKKLALQAWREARDVAAAAERQNAARNVAAVAGPRRADTTQSAKEQQAREYTKEVLSEWKSNKAQAEAAARAAAEERKAVAKQRELEQRAARQRELAAQMQLRRDEQARQRAAAEAAAPPPRLGSAPPSNEARRPLTAQRQAELLARDRQIVERRRAALAVRQEHEAQRGALQEKLAASVKVVAKADPGRLLKPTEATRRRVEIEKENEHAPKDSGFIRHVPRRAQGLP